MFCAKTALFRNFLIKSLQLGQADCRPRRALNRRFLTTLPCRPSFCWAGLVLQVTQLSTPKAQGPLQHLMTHHPCLCLRWNSSIRYLSGHISVLISHRILNPPSFHDEGLYTTFNAMWIPLRIAVMSNNICLVTCYKDSSCWFGATERRHISIENSSPLAICSSKCFRRSYGAWVYLCKPEFFDTEHFLFRNN